MLTLCAVAQLARMATPTLQITNTSQMLAVGWQPDSPSASGPVWVRLTVTRDGGGPEVHVTRQVRRCQRLSLHGPAGFWS